jgi:replicative DNA helicase
LGLWDKRSYEKRLPSTVFALPDDQIRVFLSHLWATDGCLYVRPTGHRGPAVTLYYATSSPRLAEDLVLLLRRLGIIAKIAKVDHRNGRMGHNVYVYGVEQQRRFLREIGCHGARGETIPEALERLDGVASNPNVDELHPLATDDLMWDEIIAIEPLGEQEVFDATVAEHHNFVAEGLVLHNSIEQDADIVGFIYRDEVYDEDSPDKGIAELIVAKHRNGATGVVKLAFLNHLTTFANLARNAPSVGGGNGAGGPPTPV